MIGSGTRSLSTVLAVFIVFILAAKVGAQETIYVGEYNPSSVHAFTFNGGSFTEQILDSSNPGKFLRAGLDPNIVVPTDHFFFFASGDQGITGSLVDPFTKTEFSRVEGPLWSRTATAISTAFPTSDQHYILAVGNDGFGTPYLTVVDIWPSSPSFLSAVATLRLLPVPATATSDPGLQSANLANSVVATLSTDSSTLYVGMASSSDLDPDAAVVAIDVTSPASPSIVGAVRVPTPAPPYPGIGPSRWLAGIRNGTIGGAPYLFLLRRDLYLIPLSNPLSSSTPLEMGKTTNPTTGQNRVLQDITIQDGAQPRAFALSQSCTDDDCFTAQKEILTIDLSGALAGNPTGGCTDVNNQPTHPCVTNGYTFNAAGDFLYPGGYPDGDSIQQSLGGNYLYVIDAAGDPFFYPSRLLAFDPSKVAAGSANPLLAQTNVDLLGGTDPNTAIDFSSGATSLLVRNKVTRTVTSIAITSANVDGGTVFSNDTAHTLTVTGSGLTGVVWAFLGATKLTGLNSTSTVLTATVPNGVPAGNPALILMDSNGGLSTVSGLTIDNPAQYLPASVVYAIGASCDTYSVINTASGSEVSTSYPSNAQGPVFAKVTKDGKYLFINGIRDGRVAVHSLIADPKHSYGWNTPVETLYAGVDTLALFGLAQNPDPTRNTIYLNAFYYVVLMDPTTYPPSFIDSDGNSGTTDPNMPAGITTIALPGGRTDSIVLSRDGKWLYAGNSTSEIVSIDVSSDVAASRSIIEYPVPVLTPSLTKGLAVSADNSLIFFAALKDDAVHAFSRNVSDGSVNTSSGVVMAPPASDPWTPNDVRFILAPPDGRFVYVSSRGERRLDVFDGKTLSWIVTIPVGIDSAGVEVSPANPTNDYLFIPDLDNDSVLVVDERDGSATEHQIITITHAAGATGVAVSPGVGTVKGKNISVTPTQDSTVTYSNVTTSGNTTVTSSNVASVALPSTVQASGSKAPVYYDVSTTASFSGPVTVCFNYDPTGISLSTQKSLSLWQLLGGSWNNVTTTVDTINHKVCGNVTSLSEYVIAEPTANAACSSSIVSNFNGTAITAGSNIWFNSVMKVSGLGSAPTTIYLDNATIQFSAGGTNYNLSVPPASITFSPTATAATTTFDGTRWVTVVPSGLGGNTFLTGLSFPVPVNLPGGINPVTWTGRLTTDTPGVSVNWQWAAAVYNCFSTSYSALGVKPVDSNSASIYKNSDHAGTPENFKSCLISGARGGGGSNFTGGYSGTASTQPCPAP
jgi:hypothetical protein